MNPTSLFRTLSAALALPLLLASGAASAAYQLQIPMPVTSATATPPAAGGSGALAAVAVAAYPVGGIPTACYGPDWLTETILYSNELVFSYQNTDPGCDVYGYRSAESSQIHVTGGTPPYQVSAQMLALKNYGTLTPWTPCSAAAGPSISADSSSGDIPHGCLEPASSVTGTPIGYSISPSYFYEIWGVGTWSATANDQVLMVSIGNYNGNTMQFTYQLTVTDSAGASVVMPVAASWFEGY